MVHYDLKRITLELKRAINEQINIQDSSNGVECTKPIDSLLNELENILITGEQEKTKSAKLKATSESNKDLQNIILEKTNQIVYDYPLNSTIKWFGAIEQITGYSQPEFSVYTSDDYIKLIHNDDKQSFILQHAEARKLLIDYKLYYRLKTKQGLFVHIEDNGRYYMDADNLVRMTGMLANVTNTVRAESLFLAKEINNSLLSQLAIETKESHTFEDVLQKAMEIISLQSHWILSHTFILYNHKFQQGPLKSMWFSAHPERHLRIVEKFDSQHPVKLSAIHLDVITSLKALWVNNLQNYHDHVLANEALEAGLRCMIILPVYISGQVVALIEFYSEQRELIDEYMPELMQNLGVQLGIIAEHKMAELELNKFSMAIEQNQAAVVITDIMGYIEYVNNQFLAISGYSHEEILGKKPNILRSGIHEAEFYNDMWQTLKKGRVWQGEICNKRKNGTLYWEQVNISPLKNSRKEIINYVAVKTDISEKKLAEDELRQAKLDAETANKTKSEFLANISHEIRTPMNSILGFTELLFMKISDEQQLNYLDSIKSSGKNLLTLINDVLDLSKIDAGRLKLHKEYIDPFLLFKDLEYLFSLKAREKGLEFKIETDLSLPIGIETDEVRLRQIMINLIGNAIKFTDTGSVKVNVTCVASENIEGNEIDMVITVSDTGIGIKPDFLNVIFSPFTQQDGQSTKKYGGTGLGLSITKRLVEILNGEIRVESNEDLGSTFIVKIHQLKSTKLKPNSVELLSINPRQIKFKPAKILIADDVEANRKYLKSVLSETDLQIIESSNGSDTYELAQFHNPHLIITDIKMPVFDGFELLRRIRKNPALKHIPVVATTASASIEEKEKLKVHNFDGILIKPIQVNDVFLELIRILPHDIIEKEIIQENEGNIAISAIADSDIKTVRQLLEHELYAIWSTFEHQQPLTDVENFAYKLRDTGKNYSLDILISYGNRLLTSINNFDIDTMLKTLKEYPRLLATFITVNEE